MGTVQMRPLAPCTASEGVARAAAAAAAGAVIQLINDFKKYKQSIIIITHDRDVYPLFDETINI